MAAVTSFDTEAALLQSLRGEFNGTHKTKVGNAFHAIIEKPDQVRYVKLPGGNGIKYGAVPGTKKDPEIIAFHPDQVQMAIRYKNDHPGMIHEVKVRKMYPAGRGNFLMVTGRTDGIAGRTVHDTKTRYKSLHDIREYIESCQSKFYMDMLNVPQFYYDLFEVIGLEDHLPFPDKISFAPRPAGRSGNMTPGARQLQYDVRDIHFMRDITIARHSSLHCSSYPSMRDYLVNLCSEFMDFIDNRNLYKYLKLVDEYNMPIQPQTI